MVHLTSIAVLALANHFVRTTLAQKCSGQSCEIANLSGSTGKPYDPKSGKKAQGSNAAGFKCISTYYDYGAGIPPGCGDPNKACTNPRPRQPKTVSGSPSASPGKAKGGGQASEPTIRVREEDLLLSRYHWPSEVSGDKIWSRIEMAKRYEEAEKAKFEEAKEAGLVTAYEEVNLEKRQACKPNTLIFARGTLEFGTLGSTVGPSLSGSLGSKWSSQGVTYDASIEGDNCIGLPGGVACAKMINRLSTSCPSTKIIVSGYSQGAMVARICVAFADEKARKQVAGIVTFGDPFNGAPVKDFPYENIKVICKTGDGVCGGSFSVTASHLAYTLDGSVGEAAKWMNSKVGG